MQHRVILALLLLSACDGASTADAGTDAGYEDPLRADCEPLVPEFCALPWPSDYFLANDPSTPTGHRIALGPTTLPRALVRQQAHVDPTPLATRDGWSVNASLLAYLPGATATGLPNPDNIASSLDPASPIVLINAATGERVPHFSEIDESVGDPAAPRAIIIRPAVVLDHGTRYIVAIRNVVDAGGTVIPPSDVFRALRDGTDYDLAYVRDRRAHFEEIFTTLATAGVGRADLQLAWDFTTGSLQNDTQWMLAVRDAALAAVGPDGPDYRIDSMEDYTIDQNPNIARRIFGTMIVPLFLTDPNPGSTLNFGPDGMPMQNGTAEYPFIVNIPRSATPTTRVKPLEYGHGLLGSREQANAGWLAEFGNANGYMPFGVDWIGMADIDFGPITIALANGTLQNFRTVPERLCQGVVNALLAMRLMRGAFAADPAVGGVIDTSEGFYMGDSQGGILGATFMAISTDVLKGILGAPGQPYDFLLNRSVDFDPYLSILRTSFSDGVDIQLALNIIQQLWDRAEPGSYSRHITTDPLPGTPSHRVIIQPALGDHQVTPLGAHIMARAVGAQTINPQTRPIFGITQADPPLTEGSAIIEFDFGLPPAPLTNTPMREGDDPHNSVRSSAPALAQTLRFFQTGDIIQPCVGICDPN